MDLNTKIGRRITQRDIAINKLDPFISLINFVYLGVNTYLDDGPVVERYVTQTAIKLIKKIGGFDPNLVNGILNGSIKPKKAYIPVYDFYIRYEFNGKQSYDTYYRNSTVKKGRSVRDIVDNIGKGDWYLPHNFDGLVRQFVLKHHSGSISTYTYSHVNSFEKEAYYFYNHPAVLKTKVGLENAAIAFGKNEMKHGVYSGRDRNPRNLQIERYGVYLFEVMVFEYSSGNSSPAFIALTTFKPDECYAYQQKQGAPNDDYTGKGTSSSSGSYVSQPSSSAYAPKPTSAPAPTYSSKPKESATSLVTPSSTDVYHPAPSPERQKEITKSIYQSGVRHTIEREREAYMDLIWKKRNNYNLVFYICYVLSIIATFIIDGFSRFYLIIPFFALIIGLRVFFIKKFTFERKQDLTSYINDKLDNMKAVLKTYRLLMIFGALACILFTVLMGVI